MCKKLFIIIVSVALLIFVFGGFVLAKELEVKYPTVSEETPAPTSTETSLTDYIRYVFALSIRIAGFIALGVMIYGGIKWLVSGGSPGKIADARKQILGGFLGIVILLSSYLILKTINPAIVSTTITKEPTCNCDGCNFNQEEGKITNCGSNDCNCEKCGDYCSKEKDYYKYPGVYLIGTDEDSQRVLLNSSLKQLTSLSNQANPDEVLNLNDKVANIRFGRNNNDSEEQYCAILHEDENGEGAARIICQETSGEHLYTATGPDPENLTGTVNGVSSITIFQLNPEAEGDVDIFRLQGPTGDPVDDFYEGDDTITVIDLFHEPWPIEDWEDPDRVIHNVYSFQISGSLLVLICGEDYQDDSRKRCLAFVNSHPDLHKTDLGLCDPMFPEQIPTFIVTESCVENFHIFKVKF